MYAQYCGSNVELSISYSSVVAFTILGSRSTQTWNIIYIIQYVRYVCCLQYSTNLQRNTACIICTSRSMLLLYSTNLQRDTACNIMYAITVQYYTNLQRGCSSSAGTTLSR
jgi:hypothetical protein